MAHKKGAASTKNGRDSNPQYRCVKCGDGEQVTAGSILVRQLGTKFHPGPGVGVARDRTLYALHDGKVRFDSRRGRRRVSIVTAA